MLAFVLIGFKLLRVSSVVSLVFTMNFLFAIPLSRYMVKPMNIL